MRLGSSKFYLNAVDSRSRWLRSTGNVKRINGFAFDQRGRYVTCWCLQVASWSNFSPPNYYLHLFAPANKTTAPFLPPKLLLERRGLSKLSRKDKLIFFYFVFSQLKHKSNQTRYGRWTYSHLIFLPIDQLSLGRKTLYTGSYFFYTCTNFLLFSVIFRKIYSTCIEEK
jgi:hypothetical protein